MQAKKRMLWPKEHGAYAQLLFPLITVLAQVRWNVSVATFAIGAVAVFLVHEPVLVLLGHRGQRALDELRAAALRRVVLLGGLAVVTGSIALLTASMSARGAAFGALGLGLLAAVFIVFRQEKTALGECFASAALAFASLPVALAGGASRTQALSLCLVWTLVFVMSTLAVHSMIRATKAKQERMCLRRWSTLAFAVAVPIGALLLLYNGLVSGGLVLALVPVSAVCIVLSVRPPHARWLRQVGWGIVAACTASFATILIAG